MPVRMAVKKVKRFVIDVNTFITVFINRETQWLQHYIIQNSLQIFVDSNLIEEMSHVLDYPHLQKYLPLNKTHYLTFIRTISVFVHAEDFEVKSPDPEDDYLYNLAITANAKLLVTGEKALLQWQKTPVETINLAAFKKLY